MPKEGELCVVPEKLDKKPDESIIEKFISPMVNKKEV